MSKRAVKSSRGAKASRRPAQRAVIPARRAPRPPGPNVPADALGLHLAQDTEAARQQAEQPGEELREEVIELQRAEESLRESEQRLRFHVENSPLAVVEWDNDFIVTRWAGEAEKVFGWTAAETVGKPITHLNMIYQDDIPAVQRVMATLTDGVSRHVISRNRNYTKAGEVRHCVWHNSVLHDAAGRMTSVMSLVLDVTEQKQAEAALHESEERLRLAQQAANIGAFEWNVQTGVNVWTPELEAMHGLAPGEFGKTQSSWEQLVHPEDRARAVDWVNQTLQTGEPVESEWRVVWPDGSVHWIAGRFQAFKGAAGKPVRLSGVNMDITARKQAEEALRQSREDLDRAQRVGQIGSWRLDVQRNVLMWSDENHRIFGVPKGTPLTYEAFLGIVHPDDRGFVDRQWMAGLRGEPYDIEHRIVTGGQVKWVREKAYLEFDDAGRLLGGFGITQDITKRKQDELALRVARDTLEQRVRERTAALDRTNRRLRAEMARREKLQAQLLTSTEREQQRIGEDLHDGLCQVLTGARFRSGVLLQQLRPVSAPLAEEALAIDALLADAVEQARDLSYGLNPLPPEPDGLMRALNQLAERMGAAAGPHCACHIPQPVEIRRHAVAQQLYRIAQEAVQNALKHAGARHITIELTQLNGVVTLSVRDDGAGIQRPRARRRGMGLANMSRRARLTGGALRIEKVDPHGVAVICRMPCPEKKKDMS
jgi:PAS domain S-box-containing protein